MPAGGNLCYDANSMETVTSTQGAAQRVRRRLQALLAVSIIWAGPLLACGSFAPRPTTVPTPLPLATPAPGNTATPLIDLQATPIPLAVADTPTPEPTATFTPTPLPGTALAVGQPARVTAPAGLNMRDRAATGGALLLQLSTNQRVTVVEGPVDADNFRWWKVDDGLGNVGWVAESDGETNWLSPQLGVPQPVNRAPRVGDRVQVTMSSGGQLSVRLTPGTNAELVARANPGDQFTVMAGPQEANGYTWFQIRSDDGAIEGWAADGTGAERWISPLE
jgi:hypothetical protein